ncbi:hypothetical protein F4780DRAFT_607546 [Xylariomycetidae sp. FL0641]|nr:hypothetical protein F4780DRAFT_607546 [Xylariomycetidae sp. FL0641]
MPRHICRHCRAGWKSILALHQIAEHINAVCWPLSCAKCEYKGLSSEALRNHGRHCHFERPEVRTLYCEFCTYSCSQLDFFCDHLQTCHPQTLREHQGLKCIKEVISTWARSGFRCRFCDAAYPGHRAGWLQLHVWTKHPGEARHFPELATADASRTMPKPEPPESHDDPSDIDDKDLVRWAIDTSRQPQHEGQVRACQGGGERQSAEKAAGDTRAMKEEEEQIRPVVVAAPATWTSGEVFLLGFAYAHTPVVEDIKDSFIRHIQRTDAKAIACQLATCLAELVVRLPLDQRTRLFGGNRGDGNSTLTGSDRDARPVPVAHAYGATSSPVQMAPALETTPTPRAAAQVMGVKASEHGHVQNYHLGDVDGFARGLYAKRKRSFKPD